jgi:hypothetical protein
MARLVLRRGLFKLGVRLEGMDSAGDLKLASGV